MPEYYPDALPEQIVLELAAELMKVGPPQVLSWIQEKRLKSVQMNGEAVLFERGEVLRFLGELDVERSGQPKPFPVVAIGSSAGGLEAVTELLEGLETDLEMAYVVISHLDPEHESPLPELLQKRTAMPVHTVVDGMRIKPDHVYVIPPNANMGIVDGVLTLRKPRNTSKKGFHPINEFMVALAEAYQMNAIGVVLSGTATDGTLGLKAIKAGGGWTFAQDESATYFDMPRHAQEAGAVDFVLSPAAIAAQVAVLRRHPVMEVGTVATEDVPTLGLQDILSQVRQRSGVDFNQYKRATVLRRVLRRLVLHKLRDYESYAQLLKDDPHEADLLFDDLLINVTSFFREGRFHETLKQRILPELLGGDAREHALRIWVAGCSSGEEAVSIAITVLEFFRSEGRMPPVQIFATDLDPKMVEKARVGIYGKAAMESVSPAIMARYFTKLETGYQVVKSIRDLCVFAQHDLLKDPPFSRIDLISCQNVMIYLNNAAQHKVLHNFHYALLPKGFLALGRSESVNSAGDLFTPGGKEDKLYTKRKTAAAVHFSSLGRRKEPKDQLGRERQDRIGDARTAKGSELDQEAERLLLHRHVPASMVVNQDLEVLRFRGETAPYLAPHAGKASLNLLKLVREDLVFELRGLFRKVKEDHAPISRSGLQIEVDGVVRNVSIEVAPMRTEGVEDHFLVVFLDDKAFGKRTTPLLPLESDGEQEAKDRRIAMLEREVRDVRDQMRLLLEEAEGKSDQLQSAHEEMLSGNEELQSMNEELETSKEELQSTNEELTTINDELIQRQDELKESRDYAEGIIGTISTPLVVLNSSLRIRRANAAFYKAFRTTHEETEGMLLQELGNHQWDASALRKQLMDVLHHGMEMRDFEVKHEPAGAEERTFQLSARRIVHLGPKQRLLVTLEDVTEQRSTTEGLNRLAAIVTNSSDAVLSLDLQGRVTSWNPGAEHLFGWTTKEMTGQPLDRLLPADRTGEVQRLIERVKGGERIHFFETERKHKDGHTVQVSLTVSPVRAANGDVIGISKIERDISESKKVAASLTESERRFHLLADNMDQLAWITNADRSEYWFNGRWDDFSGIPTSELPSRFKELHHPEHFERVQKVMVGFRQQAEAWECTFPLKRRDGEYRWMLARAVPQLDKDNNVIHWFGTCTDISDMMKAEAALQEADHRKDVFLATLAHELRNPMAPLRSGLEVLQTIDGDETFRQTRKVMKRQVDHLARLVEDLLDLGRINTGSLKLRRETMDPKRAMEDAVEAIEPMVRAKGQRLNLIAHDEPCFINADPVRITQIFSNLLHNASKFTPEGGHIEVGCSVGDGILEVHVSDSGIGIPAEQHERVFEMFTQVDPEERAKTGGGLGIGLHLVKRLVEMHGGTISVVGGVDGKGTTFTISLALVRSNKSTKVPRPEGKAKSIKDSRVLLVDDNKDSAMMLSMLLRAKGSAVEVAFSGEQGLKLGEGFLPDTVFMDIGMPGMDGYETCRRMRTTDWGKNARIIALSGWGQEEDKRKSKAAGFDAHLVKPVERATLLAAFQAGPA
jgi:two-component system CheB/CheR fusion protein